MILQYKLVHMIAALLWGFCIGGVTWYLAWTASQITYVTMADGRRQEKRLPVLFRVLLPLTPTFLPFFRKERFKKSARAVFARLATAGFDDVIKPEEFMALRLLVPLLMGPALVVFFAIMITVAQSGAAAARQVGIYLAVLLWTVFYPQLWLRQAIALRHKSIVRALPFVMDLLTLSVEAGMDFMAAIRNIIDRRPPDPIGEELGRVLFEIQLGKTRRDALRAMSDRINHVDIRSLVTALVQADELGVSIGAILRIQSDQIRMKRFMRAEKLANEAPVKLLFPLLACIFPAVILILMGPIFLQVLKHGF